MPRSRDSLRTAPPEIQEARRVIATQSGGNPEALYDLAMQLLDGNHIGYARRVLSKARDNLDEASVGLQIDIVRKLALCTYKDPDLPAEERLKTAESFLEELFRHYDLPSKIKQDSLGVYGAIYKRRWEVYGVRNHLEQSLYYYLQGYAMGVEQDRGYTAVNAAY